jgi:aryl-alcohol dehydrogenase-like predicted oxidoreductase
VHRRRTGRRHGNRRVGLGVEERRVDTPIIGATKEKHLADAVAALELTLSEEEVSALEAPYTPREPTFF